MKPQASHPSIWRVPRLPVDLMFRNVLHDNTVCDYNTYVKTLVDDLRTAMLLAQENSAVEQKHQTDQYNKRTKGVPLTLGEQVLVANKGIRCKRKLSDKWEPVIYTVVDAKSALHIYRIRDRDGHERVVHRNLLLQVNFLPLDVCFDDSVIHHAVSVTNGLSTTSVHEPEVSAVDTGAATVVTSLADPLACLSDYDEDRTASWVQQSPTDTDLITDLPPLPEPSSPVLGGFGGESASPDPSIRSQPPPVDSTGLGKSDIGQRLISRFGRVVRPVCHLIESMTQVEALLGVEQVQSSVIHV